MINIPNIPPDSTDRISLLRFYSQILSVLKEFDGKIKELEKELKNLKEGGNGYNY